MKKSIISAIFFLAMMMSAVTAFAAEEDPGVIMDKGTGYTKAGAILSDGNVWIIIAFVLVVAIVVFAIIRKKKKSK